MTTKKTNEGNKVKTEMNIMDTCRVCMFKHLQMSYIFDTDCDIIEKILYCTGIQVKPIPYILQTLIALVLCCADTSECQALGMSQKGLILLLIFNTFCVTVHLNVRAYVTALSVNIDILNKLIGI